MEASRKTNFILLAAGRSSRMKSDKALLDFYGEPWILRQVSEIFHSGWVDDVIVVDQIGCQLVYQKALGEFDQVHFVENPRSDSAPCDSLLLAFRRFPFPQGVMISPIDVPLSANVIQQMMQQKYSESWVVKPALKGRGGHPVWLSSQAIQQFLNEPLRLDQFIKSLPGVLIQFVDVEDARTQMNLNTPADWEQFLSEAKNPNQP